MFNCYTFICVILGPYEGASLSRHRIPPAIAPVSFNLIQNSQAVKKVCGPQKGYGEKRCEIQGGGQEMAVMVS